HAKLSRQYATTKGTHQEHSRGTTLIYGVPGNVSTTRTVRGAKGQRAPRAVLSKQRGASCDVHTESLLLPFPKCPSLILRQIEIAISVSRCATKSKWP